MENKDNLTETKKGEINIPNKKELEQGTSMPTDIIEKFTFKSKEDYLKTLDSLMPSEYIDKRKLGGGRTVDYVPISIQQALADHLLSEWNVVEDVLFVMVKEIVCLLHLF